MTNSDPDITDTDLWECLENRLCMYPNLRRELPTNYPRAKRYGISLSMMHEYSARRRLRFDHALNLPLALYNTLATVDADVRSLMHAVLMSLDDFCRELSGRAGLRGLLKSLWSSAWDEKDPQLWSVVSAACLSLSYLRAGYAVEGFEQDIGGKKPDADIVIRVSGIRTNIDVEMWHSTRFDGLSSERAREKLVTRANEKLGKKFPNLPEDEYGVAAVVCFPTGGDLELLATDPNLSGLMQFEDRPRQLGFTYWIAGRRNGDGQLCLRIDSTPLPIQAPEAAAPG